MATSQQLPRYFQEAISNKQIVVTEPPNFDLESYIANYTGRTRFERLYLIGSCSTYLSIEALKLAVQEARGGQDVDRYQRAVGLLSQISPDEREAILDRDWIEEIKKGVKIETERLEGELKGYKNNLIKESIRMGNEDLGSHYHSIGDLVNATKAYARMRDYCTTPGHIASMSFRIIAVAVDRNDWLAVQSNVQKIRSLNQKPDDQATSAPRLCAVMGLSQLATGAYSDAAASFLATDPSLTDTYSNVISSNDVAVYGGLCAMATMDRGQLSARVLENNSFRSFLEMEPHIRRAVSFFCASKYAQCLEILEAYRTDYLLDLHLQQHVVPLYSRIRSKAIVSYFIPFSCVTLDAMQSVFQSKPDQPIERELADMITSGKLNARLDLEKRLLMAKETNARAAMHEQAKRTASEYARTARLRLLRMNASCAGVEIRAGRGQAGMMKGMASSAADYGILERDEMVMEETGVVTQTVGDVYMGNGGDFGVYIDGSVPGGPAIGIGSGKGKSAERIL